VNVILLEEAHRDARGLLTEEFELALRHISTLPDSGQPYRRARGKLIRRWLMPKTGCHIYYHHDAERSLLEVHSVWGGRRRRGPQLRV
jgi:hypothetical protein